MKLLDSLTIMHEGDTRSIELWQGDLTQMTNTEAVNVLVVSAFPNSYIPMEGTLIGALRQKGVSVGLLSKDKQIDLRETCSCWLSKKIESEDGGIQFERILCFEPYILGSPPDVVGDIFRCLAPFIIGDLQVTRVAMPLVSTGDAGESVAEMVEAIFTAAVHWMENGLPLEQLKIVEISPFKAAEIKGAFAILKKQYLQASASNQRGPKYDIFLSYSHKNTQDADWFIEGLKTLKPDIRIFIDHEELEPGVAWQEKLFRSIDGSRKVLTLYSPDYIKSKACQDEFNFASLLHSRSGQKVLFPVLLYETDLLPQMGKWQYVDCRVADKEKMQAACNRLYREL
jgi:hypothetical protein